MCWLADSNYEVSFHADHRISERVIFPVSKNESRGIEDARFVQFFDDTAEATYYATYTAYNGTTILPQLIETKDFINVQCLRSTAKPYKTRVWRFFRGKSAAAMSCFHARMVKTTRSCFRTISTSGRIPEIIQEPEHPWEFIQIGNCGSPLETDEGWIVLTHGVGPMRNIASAPCCLILKSLQKLSPAWMSRCLRPHDKEREGYVPNVVYSCGAIIHNNELVIPYAMSDINSGIATVAVRRVA
jgi:predicted GH43/DUF377 family glycosyl hydrolase